jgi:flagellum-specific ATP synthase
MLLNEKIENYINHLDALDTLKVNGRIVKVVGLLVESIGPIASIGETCLIKDKNGADLCIAEVVGFRDNHVLSMVMGEMTSISPGSEIIASGKPFQIGVGDSLLGRVLNGFGEPIDSKGPLEADERISIYSQPPHPMNRNRITEVLSTGIRTVDSILTIGKGQRMGIFSGSGVGKSVLLGMIARNTSADINVIGLVGERGREVREFIERDLGEEGLKRSVVVVSTSDQPALIRLKAAFIATSIAEYFRDKGNDVLLLMDSVTRVAMAQREIGLTSGEPPATKGYTPSVFAMLPKLLERSGNSDHGSITGLYTILVEGDDMNEPVADTSRSILDGHIVLTRKLASSGHYPAIDILQSISRVMPDVTTSEHRESSSKLLDILATYTDSEDLINIGAYVKGSNPKIDYAIEMIDPIRKFLRQKVEEKTKFSGSEEYLFSLMNNQGKTNYFMPKFKFRLDSLLRLKEEQKKQSELELAHAQTEKIKAENMLKDTIHYKESAYNAINTKKSCQVFDFQADYYYIDALEKDILNRRRKLERIKQVEHNIINEVIELTKEKKTIEKLKEKRKEEFDKEMDRKEQIYLDDISQKLKPRI